MNNLSDSVAYISRKGLFLKFNQSFADAYGIPRKVLSDNMEFIGLINFSSPEQMMESIHLLDLMMGSDDDEIFWAGELKNCINPSSPIFDIRKQPIGYANMHVFIYIFRCISYLSFLV